MASAVERDAAVYRWQIAARERDVAGEDDPVSGARAGDRGAQRRFAGHGKGRLRARHRGHQHKEDQERLQILHDRRLRECYRVAASICATISSVVRTVEDDFAFVKIRSTSSSDAV